MRALKALVIILAVVIAAAIAVLGVSVYQRAVNLAGERAPTSSAGRPSTGSVSGTAGAEEAGTPRDFGTQALALPEGSRILEMVAEGDRLILRLRLRDGGSQIVILDMVSGRRLGTLRLTDGEPTRRPAGAR